MSPLKTLILAIAATTCLASFAGEIEEACTALVLDYALHRDRFDADAYANLFAEDAVLTVFDDRYESRDAIRARMQESRGKETIRHLMSTIRIFVEDDNNASGISYVRVYAGPPGELPMPARARVVGEYHDRFVRTGDGWKIKERRFIPVFTQD